MVLFGSPELPLRMQDVNIDYVPEMFNQRADFPLELSAVIPFLRKEYTTALGAHAIQDNPIPRLNGYTQAGEGPNDERGEITLHIGLTTFGTFVGTNRSLDQAVLPSIGRNLTLREKYVSFPYILEESKLANPFSANLIVVSRNPEQTPAAQMLIRMRSNKVALYRECYQLSASGYVNLEHKDSFGNPNPFVTAVKEAKQECADRLILSPSDVRLIGLAVNWEDLDLNFFGFTETNLTVASLLSDTRRDAYEGFLEAVPFDPTTVLQHITSNRWEPISVAAICCTLIACFGRQTVESIALTIPAKTWSDFIEFREWPHR